MRIAATGEILPQIPLVETNLAISGRLEET
jgi:hypothetical protein